MSETVTGGELGSPSTSSPVAAPPEVVSGSSGGGILRLIERLSTNPNFNIEVMQELRAMQREDRDLDAKRAFNSALSAAKGELEPVLKTHDVDFTSKSGTKTKYKYEEFADVSRMVDPVFQRHGLSYRFRISQTGDLVKVSTILSHALGYSEETAPLEQKIDPGSTGMSNVQALGSTLTYLQRYSLRASIGLAAGRDTDGKAEASPAIEATQIIELQELIRETGSSEINLLHLYGVETIPELTVDQFKRAKDVLGVRMAEKRRKEHAAAGDV